MKFTGTVTVIEQDDASHRALKWMEDRSENLTSTAQRT